MCECMCWYRIKTMLLLNIIYDNQHNLAKFMNTCIATIWKWWNVATLSQPFHISHFSFVNHGYNVWLEVHKLFMQRYTMAKNNIPKRSYSYFFDDPSKIHANYELVHNIRLKNNVNVRYFMRQQVYWLKKNWYSKKKKKKKKKQLIQIKSKRKGKMIIKTENRSE